MTELRHTDQQRSAADPSARGPWGQRPWRVMRASRDRERRVRAEARWRRLVCVCGSELLRRDAGPGGAGDGHRGSRRASRARIEGQIGVPECPSGTRELGRVVPDGHGASREALESLSRTNSGRLTAAQQRYCRFRAYLGCTSAVAQGTGLIGSVSHSDRRAPDGLLPSPRDRSGRNV
jgi:hypothetical protein